MKTTKFVIFIFFLLNMSVFSQQTDLMKDKTSLNQSQTFQLQAPTFDIQGFDILKQLEPTPSANLLFNEQIMEGPVNPDVYQVGPNDVFSLGIWGIISQPIPLTVTPEGSLIIPSVGEVKVAGLTLTEAKEKAIEKTKQRYISADISLTLVYPRRFTVTVTGVGQGVYPMSSVLRASALISFIVTDSISLLKSGTSPQEKGLFSFRNIILSRKNNQKLRIDLYKYFATREDKYNPFLVEGDVINIQKYDWEGKFISVHGAVQYPGVFEYIDGDDLETALQLVRGGTSVANMDSILISRLDLGANKMTNFYVKYEENKKLKLQPDDRIVVMAYAEQRRDFKVFVLGEVVRPGPYPITISQTHISDIIAETGGFTSDAFLPTSELYRKVDTFFISKNRDSTEYLFTQRLNDVISNKDEQDYFSLENRSRIGRVNIDFEKLFLGNDRSQDVTLRDQDVIYIADNKKQVYVYGQVNKPGYVPFKEGADYEYYIQNSGGLGERADEGEIRVIKFKTREWLDPDDAKIESNDFVYVPKIIKHDFAYDIDMVAKVSSVIVSVITLTLLVIQSQK
jgi:polysaccharide biosynthesis/export protein